MSSVLGSTLTSTTVAVATSTSSTAASAAPTFLFQTIGEMYTCGAAVVSWAYAGSSTQLSLNISNINVSQQAPLSASTAAASSTQALKRQYNGYDNSYLPPINVLVASNLNPSSGNWTWTSVTVPQGWYHILANVQDVVQSNSSSFFVLNGTNTNCITQFAVSSSPSSNLPDSPSVSPSPISATSSGHSHVGAIAGGIIGGIIFFAAAFSAFLYYFLRRRYRYPRSRNEDDGDIRRWSALGIGKSRHTSYARSSVQKAHAALPTLEADQTFLGSDDTAVHEKAIAAGYAIPAQPQRYSRSNRASTQTRSSNGRASNPDPPSRRPSQNAGTGEVIQLERANTFGGGARRKPPPRYDSADEPEVKGSGTSSSRTTLESSHGNTNALDNGNVGGTHLLQHQSSFGAMRPMHVLIPDPPPSARS